MNFANVSNTQLNLKVIFLVTEKSETGILGQLTFQMQFHKET